MISPIIPIVAGMVLGLIYMLMSLGYSLIYGVMKIANLVHGGFVVIGSYLLYFFYTQLGVGPFVGMALTLLTAFLIGIVFEEYLIRPIRKVEVIVLSFTLAVAVLLEQLPLAIWGPWYLRVPSFTYTTIEVGGVIILGQQIISVFIVVAIVSALWVFLMKTKLGKAVRMVAEDPELALLSGINVENIYRLTYGVGTVLAASGGVLLAPLYGIFAPMEWTFLLKAFAIVMLGGMGSFGGAVIGALTLGLTESLFGVYVSSAYKDVIYYIVILLVLIVKPSGLLGKVVERV